MDPDFLLTGLMTSEQVAGAEVITSYSTTNKTTRLFQTASLPLLPKMKLSTRLIIHLVVSKPKALNLGNMAVLMSVQHYHMDRESGQQFGC